VGDRHQALAGKAPDRESVATGHHGPGVRRDAGHALHAQKVEQLPWHHRDPFDRILLAQAAIEDHALVSADPRMREYDVEVIW
jgi:PIN domain nuclease of toxin-antitoxin system